MSTIVYGDLSLEIGEDVGHRLEPRASYVPSGRQ